MRCPRAAVSASVVSIVAFSGPDAYSEICADQSAPGCIPAESISLQYAEYAANAACACVTWSGVRSKGHGFVDVGGACETTLLDVTEALGDIGELDDEGGGLVLVLVGVLLAEEESEGPATDEVQPAKISTAGTARAAIAALRTLDRVFTLPSRVKSLAVRDVE